MFPAWIITSRDFSRGLGPKPRRPSPENDAAVFSDMAPKQTAKFWVENLAPNSVGLLKGAAPVQEAPELVKDSSGWPVSVRWKGMGRPLFTQGLGDFLSVRPSVSRRIGS